MQACQRPHRGLRRLEHHPCTEPRCDDALLAIASALPNPGKPYSKPVQGPSGARAGWSTTRAQSRAVRMRCSHSPARASWQRTGARRTRAACRASTARARARSRCSPSRRRCRADRRRPTLQRRRRPARPRRPRSAPRRPAVAAAEARRGARGAPRPWRAAAAAAAMAVGRPRWARGPAVAVVARTTAIRPGVRLFSLPACTDTCAATHANHVCVVSAAARIAATAWYCGRCPCGMAAMAGRRAVSAEPCCAVRARHAGSERWDSMRAAGRSTAAATAAW